MQNTIFIRLSPTLDGFEWIQLNEQGQVMHGPVANDELILAEQARASHVVVIVPSADVLLTHVEVPKLSRARLLQAVPNLLEESLAEPIEAVHFALGTWESGQPLPVAVVSKHKMTQWLEWVQQNLPGIEGAIAEFVPDVFGLPYAANQWTLMNLDKTVLVRTQLVAGFAIESTSFPLLVKGMISEDNKPEQIRVYGNDTFDLTSLGVNVSTQPMPNSPLSLFAEQLRAENSEAINLLQGDFERNHKYQLTKRLLTAAGVLVVVWMTVLTAIDATKYFYLRSEVADLDSKIEVVYKSLFPNATHVVSPRVRIERLLKNARAGDQNKQFIHTLALIAPVITQGKGITLKALDYRDDTVMLDVEATDFALLDTLVSNIKSSGVTVEQSGASKTGDVIQSKVVIRL